MKRSKSRGTTDENASTDPSTTTTTSKRKHEPSQAPPASRQQQATTTTSPSKQLKIDTTVTIVPVYAGGYAKYVLLNEQEKDCIQYERAESVDLVLKELIEFTREPSPHANEFSKVPLTTDMNFLNYQICPMISRALDLLSHDRVESYEKLAAQINKEYEETIRKRKILDERKIDLIFNKMLKNAIQEKKILQSREVDKSRRPFVEQIEFDTASATSTKWVRRFSEQCTIEKERLDEKLNQKFGLNLNNTNNSSNEQPEAEKEDEKLEVEEIFQDAPNGKKSTEQKIISYFAKF